MKSGIIFVLGLAGCVVLAACGGGGNDDKTVVVQTTVTETQPQTQTKTTISPSTTPQPPPTPSGPTVHLHGFKSPTSNIGCYLSGGTGRCDIRQRSWSPPPQPSNCDLDFGQGISVGGGRAGFVCAGDTTLDPRYKALPYGQSSQIGPIRCSSTTSGMTCKNTGTGHGFFLSRQSYRIF